MHDGGVVTVRHEMLSDSEIASIAFTTTVDGHSTMDAGLGVDQPRHNLIQRRHPGVERREVGHAGGHVARLRRRAARETREGEEE